MLSIQICDKHRIKDIPYTIATLSPSGQIHVDPKKVQLNLQETKQSNGCHLGCPLKSLRLQPGPQAFEKLPRRYYAAKMEHRWPDTWGLHFTVPAR